MGNTASACRDGFLPFSQHYIPGSGWCGAYSGGTWKTKEWYGDTEEGEPALPRTLLSQERNIRDDK